MCVLYADNDTSHLMTFLSWMLRWSARMVRVPIRKVTLHICWLWPHWIRCSGGLEPPVPCVHGSNPAQEMDVLNVMW